MSVGLMRTGQAQISVSAPRGNTGLRRSRRPVDLQRSLDAAVRLAAQIIGGDVAAIALADDDGYLTIRSQIGMPKGSYARWRKTWNEAPIRELRETRRRYVCSDIREGGIFRESVATRLALRGLAVQPLRRGQTLIGFLAIGYKEVHKFSRQELRLARLLASYASIAIETAALYERERHERKRSDALLDASAPRPGLALKTVLTKLCRSALKLSVAERCAVFLLSEDRRGIEAGFALGGEMPPRWETFNDAQVSEFATADALRVMSERRKPIIQEHVPGSGLLPTAWVERFKVKSLASYPLVHRRKPVGIIVAYTSRDYVAFPQGEIATLTAVAKRAAIRIENARLYEREQRERQRSETLTTMLAAATSTLSLREVLSNVCQATLTLTVGDAVSIFLVDDATGGSMPMMAAGRRQHGTLRKFLDAPPDATADPESVRFIRAIAKRKRPLLIEDAALSPLVGSWWVETFGLKSIVVYPLKVKGKAIGAMTVDTASDQVRFPREEVATLSAVARQVAVIIENARLYEREQHQRERSEKLAKVLAAASSTLSIRQVCARVCEATLKLTVGDTVAIFLHGEDNHGYVPVSAVSHGSPEKLKTFLNPPPEIQSSPDLSRFDRFLATRRKPFVIEDAVASPHTNDWWVANFGLKSLVYYPLRAKGKMVGFMSVAAVEEKRKFSHEEIDTLAAVAEQAAVIIENARLFEREQRQHQRAEALVDVLTAAGSTLSMKEVLTKVCQAVVNITVGDRCSIFMADIEGRTLEPVMSLEIEDEGLWERFRNPPPGETTTRLAEHRRLFETITKLEDPIIIEDAATSDLLTPWWVETFDLKSLVQYPLRVKDRTIGLMSVDAFRERVHFPQEEIDTLAAIAKQAAGVIENTRVYEREQRQHQRAEALVGVLTTAASSLELNKVLVKICQTAVDISVADRCSVFVVGEDGRLMPMMSLGVEDPEAWERFRNAQALAGSKASSPDLRRFYGAVTKIENPIVIEDASSSPLIPKWWLDAFQVKSLVHYPLRIKDRTIGLMTLDAFRQPVRFPTEEVETLAAIARQAAVVIENARLHEQLQQRAITDHITGLFNHRHIFERLEEELARAARSSSTFAVMMMDLDKFKDFNDTYGHLQGDEALRFIGQKLRETLRTTDIIGRYGGDEFMAILPDTTHEEAEEAGQRIMKMLADTPFSADDLEQPVPLAISIGIASYPGDSGSQEELVMLADTALYEAKRLGGKRALPVSTSATEMASSQSLGFDLLQGLLNAVAHKDPYTRRHCEDNVRYVDLIASRLRLTPEATESLRKAALLHDVGKIAIPDQTLLKPGPLDSGEWEVMQQHVRFGEMIVKGIAQISDAIEPVATHHERFDGKGYPRGLKGDEIPPLGRILAVVDAYSAMTLDRPYRKALPEEAAIAELQKGAGTQFDPAVVLGFLDALQAARRPRRKVA